MDILSRPVLPPDHRIPYGPDPFQFGDLWLPTARAHQPCPIVVFFHGGWWKSAYDLGYAGYLCAALKREGIGVWSVEYRRVGSTGGGWPNTFHDAGAGLDFLSTVARKYPLDLGRIVTMGHSAGGHLALWVAGRNHIPASSELHQPRPQLPLQAAIALAGAVDLRLLIDLASSDLPNGLFAHDRDEVHALMGGTPQEVPARYQSANPGDLLPLQCPQILIQGTDDDQIPPTLPSRFAQLSQHAGSQATVAIIPNADHLDVVDPTSAAWPTVLAHIKSVIAPRP